MIGRQDKYADFLPSTPSVGSSRLPFTFAPIMSRVLAYLLCVAGFVWLGLESVRFRRSIRESLQAAYARMNHVVPEQATDAGKVLNSYYEDVYAHLPSVFWPAGMLLAGATILFLVRKSVEPCAPPKDVGSRSVDTLNGHKEPLSER